MNDKRTKAAKFEQERQLDESLEETFPASDPISQQQMLIVGRGQKSWADTDVHGKTEESSAGPASAEPVVDH